MTEELAIERVAHYPMPGMNAPSIVRFSPDGRLLTYLWSEDASLVRQLWAFDLVTGETRVLLKAPGQGDTDQTVSPDEALRRERLRMRGFGITSYAWAERQPLLLVPMLGRLYVSDDLGRSLLELSTDGEAIDPHLSPSGDRVAYVQDGDLWVIGTAGGAEPKRLTFGASSPTGDGGRLITNGLAEFIAQEEMGRSQGFWWSQDGSLLAFQQTDVSEVSQFMIVHDSESPPSTESHRYPFAGGPNARVRLGVIGADGSNPRWVPLPGDKDIYLARVDWTPGGLLLIQIEQRDQRRLDLLAYDPSSQSLRTVLSESSDNWINLHDDLRVVGADTETSDSYSILWSSERSGYRHLYLYNSDGQEITQLTTGDWPVDRVVDARGGWVYFLAGRDSPLERHLYRVRLSEVGSSRSESDGLQKLSAEPGMHSAVLAPSGDLFADVWESAEHPPSLELRSSVGELIRSVFAGDADESTRLDLTPPEFLSVEADDGTPLHAALYTSPLGSPRPAPLIVSVYGGPHAQQVSNSWGMTVDLRAQYLARRGFAVLKLDNRGSARRGCAFESAIRNHLGYLEVRDQVAGVRAVSARPEVDGSRVGIYGWSYGGYMTIMCMLRAPDIFRAGVAGAPVTDWSGYDTHYTERYMRSPSENEQGYRDSSAIEHAGELAGSLLLVHGMIDENVHFRHTVRFVDALIAAQRIFRLLPFPHERHMPRREEDRCFMERQVFEHFLRHL